MTADLLTPSNYRNTVLADRIRDQLIDIYGRKCAECGVSADAAHLEINHIYGRDWVIRDLSRYRRFLRYRKEAREGRINLLCPDCNKRYQVKRHEQPSQPCPLFAAYLQSNQPF